MVHEEYGDVQVRELEIRAEQIRRIKITKQDLDKYQITVGCPGCLASNRGVRGVNQTEKCRKKIEEEIQKRSPKELTIPSQG